MEREETRALIEEIVTKHMGGKVEDRCLRHIWEILQLETRVRHAEANNAQLARKRRTDDIEPKTLALVESLRETLARQDEQIKKLKEELTEACERNHERNVQLDALHFVWCDGGCLSGAHRFDHAPEKVTAEVVKEARKNTDRLERWWASRDYRVRRIKAGLEPPETPPR
jgi:hypothetical protein